jgi:hypothetical protein
MKILLKFLAVSGFLGMALSTGGCGGGGSTAPSTVSTVTSPISGAAVNNDGTATTSSTTTSVTAPANAPAAVASMTVSLPANTIITAKDASGNTIKLTSAPSFVFQAPVDSSTATAGISGVPLPVTGGFTAVRSAALAVDVQIAGAASATFTNPIIITIPAPGMSAGSVVNAVYQNKNDGAGYSLISGGPFIVSANGTIAVSVSNLCWFVGDPVFMTSTGSTGSSGSVR